MRRRALAMGAAVCAAVPLAVSSSITAYCADVGLGADLPSWEQFRSLYDYNLTDPTIEFLYGDPIVGSWWRYYYSALYAIVEGVYINGAYEIVPGDFSGLSGYYIYNGYRRFGALYASGVHSGITVEPTGGVTLCAVWSLQDGALECSLTPSDYTAIYNYTTSIDNNRWTLSWLRTNANNPRTTVFFHGTGICDDCSFWNNTVYNFYNISVTTGDPPTWSGHSSDYISRSANSTPLLGQAMTFPEPLPSNDTFPTITRDNALDYVANVLNPYMEEKAPDITPYLYDPNATPAPAPTYPVQETWAENADWPEGNLLPTIPAADYSVDIPEIMTEGVAFWWRCLGVLFDGLGITAVVVGLLALGIVLYFVLR